MRLRGVRGVAIVVLFVAGGLLAGAQQQQVTGLASFTLDNERASWSQALGSGRLFVVAVGSFDSAFRLAKLNATLGTIPRAAYTWPPVPSFSGAVKPGLLLKDHTQSLGPAYLHGDYRDYLLVLDRILADFGAAAPAK